jgi:hypothetical protein
VEEREKTGGFALHEPAVPIWPNAQGLVFDEDVCIAYDFNMSMAELIYEKAKSLPGGLQSQALGFVEYLGRRARAEVEAAEWRRLFRETRTLSAAPSISEEEIAAEIAAYRSGQ